VGDDGRVVAHLIRLGGLVVAGQRFLLNRRGHSRIDERKIINVRVDVRIDVRIDGWEWIEQRGSGDIG